jgi:hypothetical protein
MTVSGLPFRVVSHRQPAELFFQAARALNEFIAQDDSDNATAPVTIIQRFGSALNLNIDFHVALVGTRRHPGVQRESRHLRQPFTARFQR